MFVLWQTTPLAMFAGTLEFVSAAGVVGRLEVVGVTMT
jgi:hypothetical protein